MIASVTEWLDASASSYPDKLAIADANEEITFAQYRSKALAVAREIIALNVGRKRAIVVYLPKCGRALVSFAAIAYAGCFYSPIDIEMPEARARKILEIFEPAAAITTRELLPALRAAGYDGPAVIYEEASPREDDEQRVLPTRDMTIDTDLLYVLFTSGSTGTPKGVCIAHRSVVDYIEWVTETFDITSEDVIANQAPFYFDMSVLDIYCMMRSAASYHIVPPELFPQPVRLLEFLRDRGVTTISWVPSALIMVSRLKALRNVDLSGILKKVLFCGEVMPNKQLNIWRRYLPDCLYANFYGPTEVTHACTCYIVDREFADDESLPIGRPARNEGVLVLDEDDREIPPSDHDSVGELCVLGSCLSPGYYKDPKRTSEVFTQNPLNDAYEEKIYRTGDIVRWNDRGELIYLSRKDHQIKHMGHRIELGEIETAASSLPGASLCCCLYDEERSRIVLIIEGSFDKKDVNARLSELLPHYMIPGGVVCLERMPMNSNGKVDRILLKDMIRQGKI